jgi:hypothetical protein
LALNFRVAVNMLQLIDALKSTTNTTIDGFQRFLSSGFHLKARYDVDSSWYVKTAFLKFVILY